MKLFPKGLSLFELIRASHKLNVYSVLKIKSPSTHMIHSFISQLIHPPTHTFEEEEEKERRVM